MQCPFKQFKGQKSKVLAQEKDFELDKTFLLAQRGLPTPYKRTDYYAVTKKVPETVEFLSELQDLYRDANKNIQNHSLIVAFNPQYWNNISPENPVKVPKYSTNYQSKYKNDIQLLLLVKKNQKNLQTDAIGVRIMDLLKKYNLIKQDENPLTVGLQQVNKDAQTTVLGGHFNDKLQLPKDPYKFNQFGLIGYEDSAHLGGSYLFAQKIEMKWNQLETVSHHWETIIGRKDRTDNDTIFSQNFCPHSHIRSSRVKDEFGNPISMVRQTKVYFDEEPEPGTLVKERGSFFTAYLKNVEWIEKICENQIVMNDSLLPYLTPLIGAILYVPNLLQLNTEIDGNPFWGKLRCRRLRNISKHHNIDWEDKFPTVNELSKSPYLLYSRNQYMQRMSTVDDDDPEASILRPPTARTLRLLAKTFALWQDTWYYDRKQQQLKHLKHYLAQAPILEDIEKFLKVDLDLYHEIPMQLRQALAVYIELGHVLTSEEYGCRGPNKEGKFGAQTFHVEPEDLLAGGEANLTFGQGKHLIYYLTQQQNEENWYNNATLSEHSGVGHIVPYMDEIFDDGLQKMIDKFKKLADAENDKKTKHLWLGAYIALVGFQKYFLNYAELCDKRKSYLSKEETFSRQSLTNLAANLRHIAVDPPKTLVQGTQLALSIFVCLHITGEPVSIGRLDQHLARFMPEDLSEITEEDQEVIDHFWIKVGEKTNLNKAFFEDHQKWGNLAMGGMASAYPQGASFNQWGHQLTVGGSKRDGSLAYNAVTLMCLRAARRIPVNAPCLGLRVRKDMPKIFLEEASKAILSGGAHPIFLNDDRVIPAIVESGNYSVNKEAWDKDTSNNANYNHYNPTVAIEDARDYSSDGCHEFLFSGKCWFCLSGLCVLLPLEILLNEGKQLLQSGPRFIHGVRSHYIEYKIADLQKDTYENFEDKFFHYFKTIVTKNYTGQLGNYGRVSEIFPTSLLNAFTSGFVERKKDFYSNGTKYNIFAPQYTGISNLANALWNIKKYVFDQQEITLLEIREMLLNNWGKTIAQPFLPDHLPNITKGQFIAKCTFWRDRLNNSQEKYGLNTDVTNFGLRIAQKLADTTVDIFKNPNPQTVAMMKKITGNHANQNVNFGFQIMPGSGTFENYEDTGTSLGASFDGRLKGQTIAQDMSLQNYLMDHQPLSSRKYSFKEVLARFRDPKFSSGSVLDFNIDENTDETYLCQCLEQFTKENGPNIITVTVCDHKNMVELQTVSNKDLLRFRMGGWSEFGVAMFPKLLDQHIRRIRYK